MFHTQINGTIVVFSGNWTIKAHVDFRGSVPLIKELDKRIIHTVDKKLSPQLQDAAKPMAPELCCSDSDIDFNLCSKLNLNIYHG